MYFFQALIASNHISVHYTLSHMIWACFKGSLVSCTKSVARLSSRITLAELPQLPCRKSSAQLDYRKMRVSKLLMPLNGNHNETKLIYGNKKDIVNLVISSSIPNIEESIQVSVTSFLLRLHHDSQYLGSKGNCPNSISRFAMYLPLVRPYLCHLPSLL